MTPGRSRSRPRPVGRQPHPRRSLAWWGRHGISGKPSPTCLAASAAASGSSAPASGSSSGSSSGACASDPGPSPRGCARARHRPDRSSPTIGGHPLPYRRPGSLLGPSRRRPRARSPASAVVCDGASSRRHPRPASTLRLPQPSGLILGSVAQVPGGRGRCMYRASEGRATSDEKRSVGLAWTSMSCCGTRSSGARATST